MVALAALLVVGQTAGAAEAAYQESEVESEEPVDEAPAEEPSDTEPVPEPSDVSTIVWIGAIALLLVAVGVAIGRFTRGGSDDTDAETGADRRSG